MEALSEFNDETVYEILKSVARNENYFVKVRKAVLKALGKMQISDFNEHISHEMFLLKFFDKRNFDETSGFYRPNNFQSILEYLMDKSLVKAIAKCKEQKLKLNSEKEKEIQQYRESRQKHDFDESHESKNSAMKEQKGDNEASVGNVSRKSNNSNKNKKISLMRNTLNTVVGAAGAKHNEILIKEALLEKYPDKFVE